MPPATVTWSPRALQHAADAQTWWVTNRPLAAHALQDELTHVLDLIAAQPNMGVRVTGRRFRRVLLSRTGYLLCYRTRDGGRCVDILALWHAKRGTKPRL